MNFVLEELGWWARADEGGDVVLQVRGVSTRWAAARTLHRERHPLHSARCASFANTRHQTDPHSLQLQRCYWHVVFVNFHKTATLLQLHLTVNMPSQRALRQNAVNCINACSMSTTNLYNYNQCVVLSEMKEHNVISGRGNRIIKILTK